MTTDLTTTERDESTTPEATREGRVFRPLTDIAERDGAISLIMEMPGVARDDIDITLEGRVLTISGRAGDTRPEKLRLTHAEYGEGDYERAFTLSQDLDPDRIEATMKNGLLTVTLPRAEAAKPKKIAVKSD
jgi:HSP20 family molecular chaperone IbpA